MRNSSRFIVAGLLLILAAILMENVRFLFTTPVPNTWVWWPGDETWLMSQYKEFLTTGHYLNPQAPGSQYGECSGVLFGSCYLTAAIYGVPALLLKSHTIDIGRAVSLFFSLLTLSALWVLARRYCVGRILAATGCLLLAGTVCFFLTGHSARSDMLVGFAIVVLVGYIPSLISSKRKNRDVLLGALVPFTLLINGHVLILSFPLFAYALYSSGIWKNNVAFARCVASCVAGIAMLFLAQWILLGSWSIFGPFGDSAGTLPFERFLHLRAQWSNFSWRYFIALAWAPSAIYCFMLLLLSGIVASRRYKFRFASMTSEARHAIICAMLTVVSSLYMEYYWPRSLIYILPTIVFTLILLASYLWRTFPKIPKAIFSCAIACCVLVGLWLFWNDSIRLGLVGVAITDADRSVMRDALAAIHSHCAGRPRVFSTIPGEAVAMDDSSTLITPVMYFSPTDPKMTREQLWKNARIDAAIDCQPAHIDRWWQPDSVISPTVRAESTLIFERIGTFCDIDRPYEPSDLQFLDTIRVYAFPKP